MKIAVAGTIDTPINKYSSAGTEIWTYDFCQELVKRGHKVTLFSVASSKINGKVIPVCSSKDIMDKEGKISKSKLAVFTFEQISQIVQHQDEFDLIHISIFSFPYVLPALKFIEIPVFITFHGSGMSYSDARLLFKKYPEPHYVFASNYFAKNWPAPKCFKVIHHGIRTSDFQVSEKHEDYFFWLGRISPEKRVEDAIMFAQKTGSKLIIAGPTRDREYFNTAVEQNLNKNIKYVGELNFKEKIHYYQKAKAFLFTARPPEAFGLVVLEALACGTPVIAYNVGAMSEIIQTNKNGFLIKDGNVDGLIDASKNISQIDRKYCRDYIVNNFDIKQMVDKYLSYYQET